jgi:SH3-like domain-containing protein
VLANALGIHSSFAQGVSDVVKLDDATPGIDVVITPVPGTTGAVVLELVQASVWVVDSAGNTVFQMSDARVHKLELRFGPDASMYTLTVERLSGAAEAYVRVTSASDLGVTALTGQTVLVSNPVSPLGFQQSMDLPLSNSAPSQVADFTIPADQKGTMKVSFPGAPVTAQVVDSEGRAVATLTGSAIDGLSMVLDGGQYQLTLLNTNLAQQTVANMEIMPAQSSDMDTLIPAVDAQPATGETVAVNSASCAITIDLASVNLRSGPGTGYSVLNYGFRNDQYPVGGTNSDGSWVVIGTPDGASAWMSGSVGSLSGECQNLTVYDIPYRNAPAPQVVVQQAQPSVVVVSAPSTSGTTTTGGGSPSYEDDHEDDHEDDD